MKNQSINVTELNKMMTYLEGMVDKESEEYRIFHDFTELQKKRFKEEYEDKSRPFLSIITRTQGKRPEMLTETLLCICGQVDTDFELLIIGHNVEDNDRDRVLEIIGDLPQWMQEKTRYVPVFGGTRATPLNRGFEEARGKYITILDDDDLVFDNWIEKFKEAAEENPGKIIHSYAVSQDWETLSGEHSNTPIAVDKPTNIFCEDFLITRQLTFNVCPTMALAFPSYPFKHLNIRFDEQFTTTEDWDFLMRTAFITGVVNSKTPTSIYRRWKNTENSQSLHNEKEWSKNYKTILKKFCGLPAFFDSQSMNKIINGGSSGKNLDDVQLFYAEKEYNPSEYIRPVKGENEHEMVFDLSEVSKDKVIKKLRIDPCDNGNVVLSEVSVMVNYKDKETVCYDSKAIKSNGKKFGDGFIFLKSDPQIYIPIKVGKAIDEIRLTSVITYPVPDEVLNTIFGKKDILYRAVRKAYKVLKRLLRK